MGVTVILPDETPLHAVLAVDVPRGTWFTAKLGSDVKTRLFFAPMGLHHDNFQCFNSDGQLNWTVDKCVNSLGGFKDYRPVDVEIKVCP